MARSVPFTSGRRCAAGAVRRLAAVAVLLAMAGIPGSVRGQSSPLSIEVESSSDVSRTGGPISLALRFDWRGSGVVDGQLQIELRDAERDLLGLYVLDDLYLTEGVTRQEIMLSGVNSYSNEVSVNFRLLDKSGRPVARLGPANLRTPRNGVRSTAIAVIRPEFSGPSDTNEVVDRLRLEALLPEYNTDGVVRRRDAIIGTRTVSLPPEDAPPDPLRYCTYDLVVLTGDGLARLMEQQLDALLAWIRAGGAVCLIADGRAFDGPQLDFLNALLESDAEQPRFLLNSSGEIVYGAGEDVPGALTSRCGLGRAVIAGLDRASGESSAAHWSVTSAFLWRLRREHVNSVRSTGVWDLRATVESARTYSGNQNQYGWRGAAIEEGTDDMLRMQASDMDPIPINGGSGLLTRLMPGDIRVVPLWMIGLVLMAYVAAIGPLDYIVLGRLSLRRLTWLWFPAVTLLFTLCSIGVSNAFLNVAAERRHILIRDVDDGGVVLRENRLELLFPSRSRAMTTEQGRGLFCPLRHQDFSRSGYLYNPFTRQDWERGAASPARCVGRMPTRANITQQIGQWTPQLNRSFTIPFAETADPFAPLTDPQLHAWMQNGSDGAIVQHLRRSVDRLVGVYAYTGETAECLHGPQLLFEDRYGQQWNQVLVNGEWVSRRADFLQEVSVRQQPGYFAVVSQISPTGGYRFEDMALVDPTDNRQRLLVVAVEEDNQLVLYRKLYVFDD